MSDNQKKSDPEKKCIDLESSSIIELGRDSVTGNQPEEDDVLVQTSPEEVHPSYRCDSTERELLKNHFPKDV